MDVLVNVKGKCKQYTVTGAKPMKYFILLFIIINLTVITGHTAPMHEVMLTNGQKIEGELLENTDELITIEITVHFLEGFNRVKEIRVA